MRKEENERILMPEISSVHVALIHFKAHDKSMHCYYVLEVQFLEIDTQLDRSKSCEGAKENFITPLVKKQYI